MVRNGCTRCAFKHCGQALIILDEHHSWLADIGDPHAVRVVGHTAEVEEHLGSIPEFKRRAEQLRQVREGYLAALPQLLVSPSVVVEAGGVLAEVLRAVSSEILELWQREYAAQQKCSISEVQA